LCFQFVFEGRIELKTRRVRLLLLWLILVSIHPFHRHKTDDQSSVVSSGNFSGLFESVVEVLQNRYFDEQFRNKVLPGLASEFRDKAKQTRTLKESRQVVHDFLSRIPASHLGLLSRDTYRNVIEDLWGRPYPTFGMQLVEIKGEHFAFMVLEGGPAEKAGILPWDRIVSMDGVPTSESIRLDWRSDDAHLPDDRDPPVRGILANTGDDVRFKISRKKGQFIELSVRAQRYSAFQAARASARILKAGGRTFGYIHFWFVHISGVPELLSEKLEADFSGCDGIILDLRGRGGNGAMIARILEVLRNDTIQRRRPIVALVDRQSRSAKDVLAYELRRTGLARVIGEKTAGAVIPATFANVGHDSILMFPSFKLPRYTDLLEFKPVEPDVFVERAGPYSAGVDPILDKALAEISKPTSSVRVVAKNKSLSQQARLMNLGAKMSLGHSVDSYRYLFTP
jgi:carboxyl-terminal processing protease